LKEVMENLFIPKETAQIPGFRKIPD